MAGNAWYSTVSRANAILSASNSWLARVTDVYAPRSDELETCNVLVTSPATCAVPRSRLLRILGKICLVHSEFLSFPHTSVANSLATLSPRKYSRTKIKRNVEFYIYIYTYKIRNHAVRTIRKRWQHSSLEQRNFDIRELLDGASDGSANVWQQRLASYRIVGPRERFRVGIEKKVRE